MEPWIFAGIVGGAIGAVAGVPAVLGVIGFTSAGIVAGSIASKIMSAAAIANGGGVAAGSLVSILQAIGAAGLSVGAKLVLATVGGTMGWLAAVINWGS